MTSDSASRWQFSLRNLFLFVLACAVVCATFVLFGNKAVLGVLFAASSMAPAVILRGRDRRAYLMSYFAVYGPFITMATYTLLYIACSHCKETTWTVLPYAPGLLPMDIARRVLGLQWSAESLMTRASFLTTAAVIGGLTWFNRTGSWWRAALSLGVAVALCSFAAFVVLAIIRA